MEKPIEWETAVDFAYLEAPLRVALIQQEVGSPATLTGVIRWNDSFSQTTYPLVTS